MNNPDSFFAFTLYEATIVCAEAREGDNKKNFITFNNSILKRFKDFLSRFIGFFN